MGKGVKPKRELLLATGHTFSVGLKISSWEGGKKIVETIISGSLMNHHY